MSMHIGVQLVSPSGFEQLESNKIYHLLISDAARDRVLLVCFIERRSKPSKTKKQITLPPLSLVIGMRRAKFESGLAEKKIIRAEQQAELPPWFGGLTSSELRGHSDARRMRKKEHAERIDQILSHIRPLVDKIDNVLGAENPDLVINQHARACSPQQNETRLRLWFYLFLCFGRSRWSLHYSIHNIGKWDRLDKPGQKFGRPSPKGPEHGYGTNDLQMIHKIDEGYLQYAGPGIHLSTIYQNTVVDKFGCIVISDSRGRKCFKSLTGEPFPSLQQFAYQVNKMYPLLERRYTKFGHALTRNKMVPSLGRFAESVGNLMERTEEDGYHLKQVAAGYEVGSHLPKMIVVRTIDVASGMLVGIGFSIGGERASAYKMARFCEAISKVKFCSLFGCVIDQDEWPSIGVSPYQITDRGPGSTKKAVAASSIGRPVIKEMSQSWSGQSKALIESSNPRAVKLQGQPTYIETKLSIPQLAIQEILRTVGANHSKDVSSRLNNNAVIAGVFPTPVGLWNYLDSLGRNHAIPMSFDAAVYEFLTPAQVRVESDGVYYLDQLFDSPALRASGLLEQATATAGFTVKAYVMDVCVRHIWVQTKSALIEVDAMLSIWDESDQLYISVVELEQIQRLKRLSAADFQEHKQAAKAEIAINFKAQTGQIFEQGTRKSGQAKRNNVISLNERRQIIEHIRAQGGRR